MDKREIIRRYNSRWKTQTSVPTIISSGTLTLYFSILHLQPGHLWREHPGPGPVSLQSGAKCLSVLVGGGRKDQGVRALPALLPAGATFSSPLQSSRPGRPGPTSYWWSHSWSHSWSARSSGTAGHSGALHTACTPEHFFILLTPYSISY